MIQEYDGRQPRTEPETAVSALGTDEPCAGSSGDYRSFLLECYHRNKQTNPGHSYRFLAAKLGMDVAHLHRILNGEKHLPSKYLPRIVERFGIEGETAERLAEQVGRVRRRSTATAATRR